MPELLCPAGDMERLRFAVQYGADAVYLAGSRFGMRTACENFDERQMIAAVDYAHQNGVKVYAAVNTYLRSDELKDAVQSVHLWEQAGADAVIVGDLGLLMLIKKELPYFPVHASVQSGICNDAAARQMAELGVQRVILSRELSLREISDIRQKTPPELELEAFVHGAMCVSVSGRCLLSEYLTGRAADRGDCTQPCRWKYFLSEEKRPGQYFPIEEDDSGTYLLNARDLCMIDHLPEVLKAGICSLKIEGRAKSAYYTAITAGAYRAALDGYFQSGCAADYHPEPWILEEVNKTSHRAYSTGFYFGRPQPGQCLENGGYERDWEVCALVTGYRDGCLICSQRNKFSLGERLELREPGHVPEQLSADRLFNGSGEAVDSAPHAEMECRIPFPRPVAEGAFLRRKRKRK